MVKLKYINEVRKRRKKKMKKIHQTQCYKFELTEHEFLSQLEIGKDIKPGEKLPILARNPERPTRGRRFAYIGVDHIVHIGRYGKPLKVKMLWK